MGGPLSKAFLPANDDTIDDPTITTQIKRARQSRPAGTFASAQSESNAQRSAPSGFRPLR
jgi:hypothetical protein